MSDAMLVRRALDGDARAFATLVDRHGGVCLRYATRMMGSIEDAEDVTQDALYRAHRALASYDTTMVFRTWLMTIVVNRCRSAMLYRHRREERVVVDADRVALASVDADVIGMEIRDAIDHALQALDVDQREAFLLKHVEELSYDEMSVVTGVGQSALKMRVKRACDRLRAELGEMMSAERSESNDDALRGAAARAAEVLRDEVPVRAAWRAALLARIQQDEVATVRRPGWTIPPSVAIAAGIALVLLGAGGTAFFDRLRRATPAALTIASTGAPTQSVRFVLVAPGAATVSVVGDFNQWTAGAALMHRLDDGRTWIADVPLSAGRYAYAFIVDGKVVADPAAPHAASDDFGVANSIVMVRGS